MYPPEPLKMQEVKIDLNRENSKRNMQLPVE